jgi:hypothetical protein
MVYLYVCEECCLVGNERTCECGETRILMNISHYHRYNIEDHVRVGAYTPRPLGLKKKVKHAQLIVTWE